MSARSLGSLSLDLLIKTGAFSAGLTKAERETKTKMTAIEKRAYAFGKNIGATLKTAAGAFGAYQLFDKYITNTIEAEKIGAKLDARIKALGGTAAASAKEINVLADSLQAASTFDDEAITEASTALLAFTNIGADEFARTLAASLDLAAASGDDLTATAEKLGKALNDPTKAAKALRDTGISLTDQQKELIKTLTETGRTGEAQAILLGELEKRYKGTAAAARDTLGGALTALKNSFDNLLEGDSGDSGVRGARDAIEDLNDTLNDPGVRRGVADTVSGLASIASAAAKAISVLAELNQKQMETFGFTRQSLGNGLRKAEAEDLIKGNLAGIRALARGDFADAQAAADRAYAGAFGGTVADFSDVKGSVMGSQKNVRGGSKRTETGGAAPAIEAEAEATDTATKALKSHSAAQKENNEAYAEARRQAEEAAAAVREIAESQYDWHEQVLDLQATLEGPSAEVTRDYQKQITELDAEFAAGKIKLDDYAKAQDFLTQKRDADLEKIDAQLTPYEEVNAAIQEQIKLLGMSAEQQEIYNNLKAAGVESNTAFGQSIVQTTEELQRAREAQASMDDLKNASEDLFANLIDGSMSAKDAFGQFADDLLRQAARVLANKAVTSLFSMFDTGMPTGAKGDVAIGAGSYGGAAGGSWWQSILSAWGGGMATGGTALPGKFYRVNESGMEMATVDGRDYLMTGSKTAHITPNHKLGGGTVNQTLNFALAAPTDQRSQQQIAQRAAFELAQAQRRNG